VSEATRIAAPLNMSTEAYVTIPQLVDGMFNRAIRLKVDVASAPGYDILNDADGPYLRVDYAPQAGVPVLLLPIDPYEQTSPLSLSIKIAHDKEKKGRYGTSMNVYDAWNLAWAARICGFDTEIESKTDTIGAKRFFASNETSWTHCLQMNKVDIGTCVTVTNLIRRDHVFIELPPIHTRLFNDAVTVVLKQIDTRVCATRDSRGCRVSDYGSIGGIISMSDIRIAVPAGVTKLRGFLLRAKSDFRFVNDVQAGVIPPGEVENTAPSAEQPETTGSGGSD
jgi:hypothetical protein